MVYFNNKKNKMKNFYLTIFFLLISINLCYAEENYTAKQICNSIYIIEGKEKALQPYGINKKYIKCLTKESCEAICLNTVKHKKQEYNKYGYKKYNSFLEYLSIKYCPPNSKIWLKNLKFYLKKG